MRKRFHGARRAALAAMWTTTTLLGGCAGSGSGLDVNGNPVGSGAGAEPLTADFQSIQDNVFTPVCTGCHSGAGAPEGLQLDQAHSYALLVGVPSAEIPGVERVKAGDPVDSYLIQKLQGSSGIVGQQMPFGGPYLSQATIDVIRQWITNGAAASPIASSNAVAREVAAPTALGVVATTPVDHGQMAAPLSVIAVALSEEPNAATLMGAMRLQDITAEPRDVQTLFAQAQGNPATVLLTPVAPLLPGVYRVTLRGGGAFALIAVNGASLPADYSFTFTVETP